MLPSSLRFPPPPPPPAPSFFIFNSSLVFRTVSDSGVTAFVNFFFQLFQGSLFCNFLPRLFFAPPARGIVITFSPDPRMLVFVIALIEPALSARFYLFFYSIRFLVYFAKPGLKKLFDFFIKPGYENSGGRISLSNSVE